MQAMVLYFAGKRKSEIVNNFEAIDKTEYEREHLAIIKSSLRAGRLW